MPATASDTSSRDASRHSALVPVALGIGLAGALVAVMLAAGVADQEEYQVSVFSALVNAESLRATGEPALWTNFFGFGTALPLGHSFNLHPVFLLWPDLGVPALMALLWGSLAIGAACLGLWLRMLGVGAWIAALALFGYAVSTPVLTYMVVNDWPSGLLDWALMPPLFWLLAIMAERPERRWAAALWLGALGGFLGVNGHPGHLIILLVPLALYALALLAARPAILLPGLAAALIAAAANLETVLFVLTETARFPEGLHRDNATGYPLATYLDSLLRPLPAPGSEPPEGGLWAAYLAANADVRLPFLGIGFALGALALPVAARFGGLKHAPHVVGLALGFAACLVASLLDSDTLGEIHSGAWLFRDGVILTGLALGAIGLSWLGRQRRGLRALVAAFAAVQALQTAAVAVAPIHGVLTDEASGIFAQAGRDTPTIAWLRRAAGEHGPRLYLSPGVYRDVRFDLRGRGIYAASDLALAGLHPVNGWFKGTSQDAIDASRAMMHGMIGTLPAQFANAAMLEATGVDMVLAYRSEAEAVPAGYRAVGSEPGAADDPLTLFANPDAWPRVSLLPARAADVELPRLEAESCRGRGLLCADFSGFPERLRPDPSDLRIERDRIVATLPAGQAGRIAFVSQLWRHEWRASLDGRPVPVVPVADALIGVPVPAEGGRLVLVYDTGLRTALWWLAAAVLAGSFLAAAVATLRSRPGGAAALRRDRRTR